MDIASQLHRAVEAVCPVVGIAIGDPADKSTWRVDFSGSATDAEKAAAAIVVEEFSASEPLAQAIISDRQFFHQLASLGVITTAEALAAVGPGEIPAAMEAVIATLPAEDQFPARMLLTGATSFDRSHPLVATFGLALGWTPAQLDGFWTAAAAL